MGILKNAIETVFADMGKDVKFLNTGSRVIETSAQAKYHDTLRAERNYTRGVHKARNNNNQEG